MSRSFVIGERHRRDLGDLDPIGKAAASIHALDTAASIAERIKDPDALERALIAKLESRRDFAAQYQAQFPKGGDRTQEQSASTGALLSRDWCLTYGFALRTVQRWCGLLDAETYVDKKNAILKQCWKLAELWQAANYSSESVEWYTPARYLKAVREVLGGIDLDPASNAQANAVVGAKSIFTKDDDGLTKPWHGRVFMNPPYGTTRDGESLAGVFCNKAIEEYENGNVEACIILVNSVHSQSWQAPLYKHTVCLVDHRIAFISDDGEPNKNPTFQNIFVYLGEDIEKFAGTFSTFGYVMREVRLTGNSSGAA
jgi:DNA N-6-adenine-methyltransferase (Dam)